MPRKKSEMPEIVRREAGMMPAYREFCQKIKRLKLVQWFRNSRLNPYHLFLKNIKADSYEEARQKAYDMGEVQFLYQGTRYYAERHDMTVGEEYKKYHKVLRGRGDVADRIPRDKNGNLDLFAEDPLVIAIMPIEGPSIYGHVSMQYKDRVINRLLSTIYTDPVYEKYFEYSEYYFIYPSMLGIEPKKLLREIDKHNVKYGYKKFNLATNNCSKNVADVLEKAGVKDINFLGPDKLGLRFATPGNNPFGFGLKDWCFRHGVHVHADEMAQFNEHYPIEDLENTRAEQEKVRHRYKAVVKEEIRTQRDAEAEKRAKHKKQVAKKKKKETKGKKVFSKELKER